jgi:hypothetical protein
MRSSWMLDLAVVTEIKLHLNLHKKDNNGKYGKSEIAYVVRLHIFILW